MKKSLIIAMLGISSLFSINAFANNHEGHDMKKDHSKEMMHKKHVPTKEEVLQRLGKHKEMLKERLNKVEKAEFCIQEAQNNEDYKKCREILGKKDKHLKHHGHHKDHVKEIPKQETPK